MQNQLEHEMDRLLWLEHVILIPVAGYPLTSPTSSPSSCGSLMANYSQEIFTKGILL